jgi:hypothetical protein
MALQDLAKLTTIKSLTRSNTILVEVGGSIKRITLDDLIDVLSLDDNKMILQQVAWGIPILDGKTSTEWGVYGNTALRNQCNAMKGRYLLTNAGKAAKLSATNSSIYADGTALDVSKGHIMTIKPRLYFKVQDDSVTGVTWLWMSMLPIGGYYIEQQVTGAYLAYLNGSALTSRPGVNPTRNLNITQYWNAAQVNGKAFGLADYDFSKYIVMEGLGDYGSPNIQAKLGYGVGGSGGNSLYSDTSVLTGLTASLGDASGTYMLDSSTNSCHVSLHGTEDAWDWIWEMRQGIFFGNSGNSAQTGSECYLYKGNRLPTSAELASVPTGEYRQITRQTSSMWIGELLKNEYFDILVKNSTNGSSSGGWCDYSYANSTGQLCLVGGRSGNGSYAGPCCVSSSNGFSYSDANLGARLAYYGDIEYVDGKDI